MLLKIFHVPLSATAPPPAEFPEIVQLVTVHVPTEPTPPLLVAEFFEKVQLVAVHVLPEATPPDSAVFSEKMELVTVHVAE
jgi:hypothetical protein